MHVTIVGAGALGRVYGTRLARSLIDVSFVVRQERLGDDEPFVIEQVNGDGGHDALEEPHRVLDAPASTDAILVTVRADQVNAELARHLEAAREAPIVMLTPMLPGARDVLEGALGRTVVPAMPGVVGYENDAGAVRYWIVKAQATLIEDGLTPKERNQRGELARHLSRAGIITRVEENVGTTNAATTAAFFPFVVTIAAAGSVDAALADKHLVSLMLDAAKECDAIAKTLGNVVSTAGLLMKFVGPFTLKAGVSLAKRVSPEAVHFVELHFGPKLGAQHVAMGNALLDVAREHQIATPALRALLDLVAARVAA